MRRSSGSAWSCSARNAGAMPRARRFQDSPLATPAANRRIISGSPSPIVGDDGFAVGGAQGGRCMTSNEHIGSTMDGRTAPIFDDVMQLLPSGVVSHQCKLGLALPRSVPPSSASAACWSRHFWRSCEPGHLPASFFHHRRPEAPPVDGWRLALPHSVAAGHDGRLHIEDDGALRVGVNTAWPPATRRCRSSLL